LDARHSIEYLSSQKASLLLFEAITAAFSTVDSLRGSVTEWLTVFPAKRPWVPLLLAGVIDEDVYAHRRKSVSDHQKCVWTVLWEWRDEPVAIDWLEESDKCRQWGEDRPLDVLTMIRRVLANESHDALGVSAAQHKDLLVWCDRLLAEREALKAGITGASAEKMAGRTAGRGVTRARGRKH
jgi:hypothetical protein